MLTPLSTKIVNCYEMQNSLTGFQRGVCGWKR